MTNQRKRVRGNSEGSIIKLSGKRKKPFAARVTIGWDKNGKQIRKYVGYYSNKTEAKKALNEYIINPYDLSKITTIDLFEKWAETSKYSEEVLKNYKRVVENSGLSKKVFKDITLMQLEDGARELSPSMQKRYKSAFKNLYLYAMKHDLVQKDLASLMDLDKYQAKEKDAINPKVIKEILKGEDIIPKLLLYTGVRINELLSLKSKNVDMSKRIMIMGSKTAAGKDRKIPIHSEIMPIIEDLLKNNTEYLITTETGSKVNYNNYLSRVWNQNPLLEPYVIHQTRHTFVSRAIKLKLDRGTLQKIIGHSNKDTTDIYTHIDLETLIDFIDSFNY